MGIKSTRSLSYSLKGILDLENMQITEVSEDEEVVHDLDDIVRQFDGKEVTFAIKETSKLGE